MGFDLGSIFKGGAEGLLGGVDKVISRFVTSPEEKQKALQEITDAANKHIEAMATLAQAGIDAEFKAKQDELDAVIKDKDSARQMNQLIQQSDKSSWLARNIAYLIDIFVTFIWGSLTVYIIARVLKIISNSPSVDMTAVMGIYAAVTAAFTTILTFHRGSSSSAKTKDDTINSMARAQ